MLYHIIYIYIYIYISLYISLKIIFTLVLLTASWRGRDKRGRRRGIFFEEPFLLRRTPLHLRRVPFFDLRSRRTKNLYLRFSGPKNEKALHLPSSIFGLVPQFIAGEMRANIADITNFQGEMRAKYSRYITKCDKMWQHVRTWSKMLQNMWICDPSVKTPFVPTLSGSRWF